MKKPIIVIGAGNLEVAKLIHAINRADPVWDLVAYVDDSDETWGRELDGVPILGAVDLVLDDKHRNVVFVNSIGSPAARRRIAARIGVERERFATLTHPSVDLWGVELGAGSLIHEGSVVSPGTRLGDHVLLSYHVVVAHDVTLGDHSNIAPGAVINGRCTVAEGVYIGSGATILPDVSIGPRATVGAGSLVTRRVAEKTTVFGVPARVIKTDGEGA